VRFLIKDVFLPTPERVFAPLPPHAEVEGTVIGFSDSGLRPDAFAVVEAVRRQTLIVPVDKLAVCNSDGGDAARPSNSTEQGEN
jgi:hypothetical protein